MADNNNNKKPELTNSIASDKDTWTETPQNQSPENNDLENQPPQETGITSIIGGEVNLDKLSPAKENPIEIEEGTYSTKEEAYPPEKSYPEQPPEEPQINLEQPEQTTTLIPDIPSAKPPTDTVNTIAYEEEEGEFIKGVTAQHGQ